MPIQVDLIGDLLPNFALMIQRSRQIGGLVPDVVIEETGDDTMRITKHPVMQGAPISDHAFRMPCMLLMKIGYSDSKHKQVDFTWRALQELLRAMSDREPITIVTGKRVYQNMLYSHIHVTTDETTEWVLNATVAFEEVIRASAQEVSYATRAIPQSTEQAFNLGTVPTVVQQVNNPAAQQQQPLAFLPSTLPPIIQQFTGNM